MIDTNERRKVLRDIRTIGFAVIGAFVVILPGWLALSHGHKTGETFLVSWALWTLLTGVGLIFHKRWGCLTAYLPAMAFTILILYRSVLLLFGHSARNASGSILPALMFDVIVVAFSVVMNIALVKYWRHLRW